MVDKRVLCLIALLVNFCSFAGQTAYEQMMHFLENKNYQTGFDTEKKRIVTIGVSGFDSDKIDGDVFAKKRAMNLTIATLKAKAEIIKIIGTEVSAQERYKSVYKSADDRFSVKGNFSSQIDCLSALDLKGVVTLNHAESYDVDNKRYQVAVICLWSEKTEKYALGLLSPKPRPDKMPGTVQEWLKGVNNIFGARTFIDKYGKIWYLGTSEQPVSKGYEVAKSLAQKEAVRIVNLSLSADNVVRDSAAQLLKMHEETKGGKKQLLAEAFTADLSQKISTRSKAVLLGEKMVVNPVSGVRYLAVTYGYSPELVAENTLQGQVDPTLAGAAPSEEGWVNSIGYGCDRGRAITLALEEAMRKVNGTQLQANSGFKQKYEAATFELNKLEFSKIVSTDVMQSSVKIATSGLIEKYNEISVTQLSPKKWKAVLNVLVFDPTKAREKPTLVILPTIFEDENNVYRIDRDNRMSAPDLAKKISSQIDKALSANNEFQLVDRGNIDKALHEQKLIIKMVKAKMSNVREMAKVGQNVSVDYMVISKLIDYNYISRGTFDPKLGKVKKETYARLKLDMKLLDTADSTSVFSEEFSIKLSAAEIKEAEAEGESLVTAAVKKAMKAFLIKIIPLKSELKKKKRYSSKMDPSLYHFSDTEEKKQISDRIKLPEKIEQAPAKNIRQLSKITEIVPAKKVTGAKKGNAIIQPETQINSSSIEIVHNQGSQKKFSDSVKELAKTDDNVKALLKSGINRIPYTIPEFQFEEGR